VGRELFYGTSRGLTATIKEAKYNGENYGNLSKYAQRRL